MEIGQAQIAWHQHAPPDRRTDLQEENVKLVDCSRISSFATVCSPLIGTSAWRVLDTFF